jgi:hypothetical protein
VCVLVEQINYTFFFFLFFFLGGLVVCNEDETEPCLKLKRLQILCERKCSGPWLRALLEVSVGPHLVTEGLT